MIEVYKILHGIYDTDISAGMLELAQLRQRKYIEDIL